MIFAGKQIGREAIAMEGGFCWSRLCEIVYFSSSGVGSICVRLRCTLAAFQDVVD